MKVYLAGPIAGLSYKQAVQRRSKLKGQLELMGHRVISPMRAKEELRGTRKLGTNGYVGTNSDTAIFRRDTWDVRRCDLMVADLTGVKKVSIGTMVELGMAWALGKYVVVVLPAGSVHDHLFVRQAASIVFETVDEALRWIKEACDD